MDLAQNYFFNDICSIIESGRRQAYAEVSRLMIESYWKIGQRIVEEEQKGNKRAEYGAQLIDELAAQLTHIYGKGFSVLGTFNTPQPIHRWRMARNTA